MASLSDFFPYVLPYVQGCSSPLAEQHIRDACIDFCTHVPVVQVALDPISAIAGQIEYDLDVPNGTTAHLVLEAWYEGRELGRFKFGDAASVAEQFATGASNMGIPTAIIQTPSNTIRLNVAPAYDAPNAMILVVTTKPTRKALTVSDILLNDYADVIGNGAVARIMRIPGSKFTNPNAFAYDQLYTTARSSARIRAEQSFGRSGGRIKPRRFI